MCRSVPAASFVPNERFVTWMDVSLPLINRQYGQWQCVPYIGSEATRVSLTDRVSLLNKSSEPLFCSPTFSLWLVIRKQPSRSPCHFSTSLSDVLQRPFKLQYLKHDGLVEHFPRAQCSRYSTWRTGRSAGSEAATSSGGAVRLVLC